MFIHVYMDHQQGHAGVGFGVLIFIDHHDFMLNLVKKFAALLITSLWNVKFILEN